MDLLKLLQVMRQECGHDGKGTIRLEDYIPLLAKARRDYRTPEVVFLRELCKQITWNAEGRFYDHDINGEQLILQRLGDFRAKVVFDVGANVGDWASLALNTLPAATVHAFEIVPSTFALLQEKVGGNDRAVLNGFGLFDYVGDIVIQVDPSENHLSTFVKNLGSGTDVTCSVTTGDEYVKSHNIDRIDFLKIDAEGAEHHIIDGFSETITSGRVDVIQFEYGLISIDTKFLLADFYQLLDRYGFVIGKLHHDGVVFKEYSKFDENFIGPNYIACRKERTDIIDHIKAG